MRRPIRKQRFRNGLEAIWRDLGFPFPMEAALLPDPIQTPRYDRLLFADIQNAVPAFQPSDRLVRQVFLDHVEHLESLGRLVRADTAIGAHRPLRHCEIDWPTAVRGYQEAEPVCTAQFILHDLRRGVFGSAGARAVDSPSRAYARWRASQYPLPGGLYNRDLPECFWEVDIDLGKTGEFLAAARRPEKRDLVHLVPGVGSIALHIVECLVHRAIRKAAHNPDFGNPPGLTNWLLRHVRGLKVPRL